MLKTIWETIDLLDRHNVGLIAAGIGFYALLSVFPALTLVVLLWSLLADPNLISQLLDISAEVVPPAIHKILADQVVSLINAGSGETIGVATLLTAGLTIWSARAGVAALIRGLNAVYQTSHRASPLRRVLSAIGLTLTLCGATIVAVASVVVVPIVVTIFPLGPRTSLYVEFFRLLAALGSAIIGLGLIYRYGPNRRGNRPPFFTPGALVATILWLVMSWAFGYYLSNFARYNQVYGSLGAAVALLMWFYLSAYIVLLGGTLNAAIERARRRAAPLPEPANQNI